MQYGRLSDVRCKQYSKGRYHATSCCTPGLTTTTALPSPAIFRSVAAPMPCPSSQAATMPSISSAARAASSTTASSPACAARRNTPTASATAPRRHSATARREQKQEQRKRDREAGLSNSKAAAVQQLRLTAQQARNDFIKRVAVALGWKPGCAAEFTAPATRRAPMCSTPSGASTIRGGGIRPLAISALWISRRWPRQAKLGVHRNASRP